FNTHGAKYKELGLKDKLKDLSTDEKLNLLASDGMLVKRPLAIAGDNITVGFKEDQYKEIWL
ncbi:ArsC/Spx/MgsR family protein, partial [Staphylococcus aureus]|uniref:ArsC/Spx/MgsR family protein n=1 Tax=Staphylococcus aureus TaxID=1280 RepID=UPI0030F42AD9